MKIEVFYVAGCPHYQPTVDRIKKVLLTESLRAVVESIPVGSEFAALALQFPGSPTVRVDGVDVEPKLAKASGLACRLYADGGGMPSEEVLRQALSRARQREGI